MSVRLETEDQRTGGGWVRGLGWTVLGLAMATAGVALPIEPAVEEAGQALTEFDGDELSEEITVTATSNPRPIAETPVSVDVIDAEQIDRKQMSDVADLADELPGVYVSRDATRLGSSGFNIRGMGGNRVLTMIDGVPTAEQFDFGPIASTQYAMDLGMLDRVEVVRSAGSALYGSDALGGVVSLVTKSPSDYLAFSGGNAYLGGAAGFDGRSDESRLRAAGAFRVDELEVSLSASGWEGEARDNQGDVDSDGGSRTTPNPQDRAGIQLLGKVVWNSSPNNSFRLAIESFDADAVTDVVTSRAVQRFGPGFGPGITYDIATTLFEADDSQRRQRLSLGQGWQSPTGAGFVDRIDWQLFTVRDRTDQDTVEQRTTTIGGSFFGPLTTTDAELRGHYGFDEDSFGGEVQFRKGGTFGSAEHLITWGASSREQDFDMLRDRRELDPETGAFVSQSDYPTKYFPESTVNEIGVFVQDEIRFAGGKVSLVPGVRYDLYELDPTETDPVYLEGNQGIDAPVELDDSAVSPRVGVAVAITRATSVFAQYAVGFRAPPFSSVNNGFTNAAFGYTTLPNPDLEPETSGNFELGLRHQGARWGASLVYYDNQYEDFIDVATLGVNPATGLLEYQPRNLDDVEIRGFELGARGELTSALSLRLAASWSEGEVETTDVPLNSVAPHQAVVGLRYRADGARWGAEITGTITEAKDGDDVDTSIVNQFTPPGSEVVDLTVFFDLTRRLRLDVGLFNALDETYWNWGTVQGLSETSSVLDRYSSPGRSFAVALRFQ